MQKKKQKQTNVISCDLCHVIKGEPWKYKFRSPKHFQKGAQALTFHPKRAKSDDDDDFTRRRSRRQKSKKRRRREEAKKSEDGRGRQKSRRWPCRRHYTTMTYPGCMHALHTGITYIDDLPRHFHLEYSRLIGSKKRGSPGPKERRGIRYDKRLGPGVAGSMEPDLRLLHRSKANAIGTKGVGRCVSNGPASWSTLVR